MNAAAPRRLPPATQLRLALFALLERASDLRGNAAAGAFKLAAPAQPERALWVYASTIGELNAIAPLLRELIAQLPHLRLVLITNHAHYETSYRAQYPAAEVCVSLGHRSDAARLGQHYPPALLVVAEIPCLPSDAPCRFSVAFVAEAKRRGAGTAIANGWLYRQQPACRMDAIERRLLGRDYVRAFDVVCMQTDESREAMLQAGADPARVHVTGNIKFDAMVRSDWRVEQARSAGLLSALISSGRPIVVAGCVTNASEQHLVLDAFTRTLALQPQALLVLAPRHPEVKERMAALARFLAEHGLSATLKSTLTEGALPPVDMQCLVLDTMGDLRDFYASAAVAHVGVDHNVLEPLGFDKAVTVVGGWNPIYPSYPVYHLLRDSGALIEVDTAASLASAWIAAMQDQAHGSVTRLRLAKSFETVRGAVRRHSDRLASLIQAAGQPAA